MSRRERRRRYYLRNKERVLAAQRKYVKDNWQRLLEYKRRWYRKNKERVAAQRTRPERKGRLGEYLKLYYQRNRAKILARAAQYRAADREKFNSTTRRSRDAKVEHYRRQKRAYFARNCAALTDTYINAMLRQKTRLSPNSIPRALVEAKRVHLQVLRKLKELKK